MKRHDQITFHSSYPKTTSSKSSSVDARLANIFAEFVAASKDEARATRELYEKRVSPEEPLEKIIARLRSKAQERKSAN